jgi:hypothetical protein
MICIKPAGTYVGVTPPSQPDPLFANKISPDATAVLVANDPLQRYPLNRV